jgi:hypothetical protein
MKLYYTPSPERDGLSEQLLRTGLFEEARSAEATTSSETDLLPTNIEKYRPGFSRNDIAASHSWMQTGNIKPGHL